MTFELVAGQVGVVRRRDEVVGQRMRHVVLLLQVLRPFADVVVGVHHEVREALEAHHVLRSQCRVGFITDTIFKIK